MTADVVVPVTVVIACHPPRFTHKMLGAAFKSVLAQTVQPAAIVIVNDTEHAGSADTRNTALAKATTEWVAFLDSDDQLLPNHLERLLGAATEADAAGNRVDVVYSWPRVYGPDGNLIPRADQWGGGPVFDPERLRREAHIQTTSLVRTTAAKAAGGFRFITDQHGASNDDHGFYLALLHAGCGFLCVPEETFLWRHHGVAAPGRDGNTSGRADRW
jgi:glycosyltransferase involved in cell wall biosynthesis